MRDLPEATQWDKAGPRPSSPGCRVATASMGPLLASVGQQLKPALSMGTARDSATRTAQQVSCRKYRGKPEAGANQGPAGSVLAPAPAGAP